MTNRKGAEKVPEKKKRLVKELADLIDKHRTICIVNMKGLPARQLQVVRNKIRDKAIAKMARKSVMRRALRACKNKYATILLDKLGGMPAFLFADIDSFELFQILKKNKSPSPAKVGQISPNDIEIREGATDLTPGPAISTLSKVGLPAGVEEGKITIKKGKIIIKKGEEFTQPVVDVLNLMKMEPMKIGVNLVAALEDSELYLADILDIDAEEFTEKIASAHSDAFKLAIELGMINSDTASFLITKAELDARALARETSMLADSVKEDVLAKVEGQAKAVKDTISKSKEVK